MTHSLTLRVRYPLAPPAASPPASPAPAANRRLLLRTENDWDADVEPTAEAADGTGCDFALELEHARPYLYFKPVLRQGDDVVWSQGENYLALANGTSAGGRRAI